MARSVGTQHRAETRASRRKSLSSVPTSAAPLGRGTRVAPATRGTQISSTEKSKAIVMPWYMRWAGSTP
ncbi:hypothetical protein LUX57_04205 [Actinomadura madurae]|nr:hypothetical protein [Actinomadura madurae]MCP9964466.1 hypothetical protein [Actinomadura madurae]